MGLLWPNGWLAFSILDTDKKNLDFHIALVITQNTLERLFEYKYSNRIKTLKGLNQDSWLIGLFRLEVKKSC